VLKDISYVLELAAQVGVAAHVTQLAERYYAATASNGWSGRYFPAVIEIVDRNIDLPAETRPELDNPARGGEPC